MELSNHDIIKGLIISEKSVQTYRKLGQIAFRVHPKANKFRIESAVEAIWEVKVEKVRVMNRAPKRKGRGAKTFFFFRSEEGNYNA